MRSSKLHAVAAAALVACAGTTASAQWVLKTPVPEARSRAAGAIIGNTFYFIGGETTGGLRNLTCWKYDIPSDTWTPIASMPSNGVGNGGVSNVDAAAVGTDIYLAGGWNGTVGSNRLLRYDSVGDVWTDLTATDPVPAAIYQNAAVSDGTMLYVSGGTTTAFYRFNPAAAPGSRWTTLAAMPALHGYPGSCHISGQIFVMGNGTETTNSICHVYTIATNSWATLPTMTAPRGGGTLFNFNGQPYAASGGWATYLTSSETYNGTSWVPGAPVNTGVRTIANDGNSQYFVKAGGWNGTYSNAVEVFVNSSNPGACCRADGTCQNLTPANCATASGVFQGVGSACATTVCPQPGACCLNDGGCTFTASFACTAPGSQFFGEGVTCAAAQCPASACCRPDGTCTMNTTNWCFTTGGTPGAATCAQANCPQPGGCCLGSGGCVTLTPNDCQAAGGVFAGAGVLCADSNCWTTPILYHNGGLVTHPGQGFGGADASQLATGANTIGENWNFAANVRLAEDFTVPAGESWTVTKFTTFGYQTGSTTTNPYLTMRVRIWDRDPRLAGAVALWGDITTNVLDPAASGWANMYRVTGNLLDTQRPVMRLVANVPSIVLGPGTYWVEYTATNGATPFMPAVCTGVSGLSVIPFGNALIWRNTPWVPVVDVTYQQSTWSNAGGFPTNMPFILEGTSGPAGCYANCDNSTQAPVLNVQDFSCFLTRYAAGESYANCDSSTQPPVLNVQDFSCFLTKYAAGC